jgi:kynureninase
MTTDSILSITQALDVADPLARFHQQFAHPTNARGERLTYLCGHSLGLQPLKARQLVTEELDDWAKLGVLGHHDARRPWIDYADALRPPLATLVGAVANEVVAMNSLTVNLHLLMASFYRPQGRRRCIVIEQGAFSSDHHAVVSQLQWHGFDPADTLIEVAPAAGDDTLPEQALLELLRQRGDEVALVLWPGVQYRTGQNFDLAAIAKSCRAVGAICGVDLAHAVGNVPLQLHRDDVDFAVWCGYKYLNGGPGAIAGAFVHSRHDRAQLTGFAGWWGHEAKSRFRMETGFKPQPGAAAWQLSNPPILATAPLLAALQLFEQAGMPVLRAKSLAMTDIVIKYIDEHLAKHLQCVTPRPAAARGNQLSLRVRGGAAAGKQLFSSLTAAGIVADWREPDILRVAAAPLYNSYTDLAQLCLSLQQILEPNT